MNAPNANAVSTSTPDRSWERRCSVSIRKVGMDVNSPCGRYFLRVAMVGEPGTHGWTEYKPEQDHAQGCFEDEHHAERALNGAVVPPDAPVDPIVPRPSVMAFARLIEQRFRSNSLQQWEWRAAAGPDVYDRTNHIETVFNELRRTVVKIASARDDAQHCRDAEREASEQALEIARLSLMLIDVLTPLDRDPEVVR